MNSGMMMLQMMPQASQLMNTSKNQVRELSGKEGAFATILQGLTSEVASLQENQSLQLNEQTLEKLAKMLEDLLFILASGESGEEMEQQLGEWFKDFTEEFSFSSEQMEQLMNQLASGQAADQIGALLTDLYEVLVSESEEPDSLVNINQPVQGELPAQQQSLIGKLVQQLETILYRLSEHVRAQANQAESSTDHSVGKADTWRLLMTSNHVNQTEAGFINDLQRMVKENTAEKPAMNWAQVLSGKQTKSTMSITSESGGQVNILRHGSLNPLPTMTQSAPSSGQSQQMLQQIEQMVLSTRFSKPGGATQMTLQLKPTELGDMILKFMKIDGEMTVKITVMSQAAKELLEKNIHQLRHLFSPNQVVVERQVETTNESNPSAFKEKQEEKEEQQREQSREASQLNQNQEEEESIRFEDFLFAEEV